MDRHRNLLAVIPNTGTPVTQIRLKTQNNIMLICCRSNDRYNIHSTDIYVIQEKRYDNRMNKEEANSQDNKSVSICPIFQSRKHKCKAINASLVSPNDKETEGSYG